MPRPGLHCGKEQILLQLGRLPVRVTVLAVAIVATVAGGSWFAMSHDRASGSAAAGRQNSSGEATPAAVPLQVVSVTPARHTRHVNGAAPVTILFSAPLAADSPAPEITPGIPGHWSRPSATQLTFTPAAGFGPDTRVTVRIPGGTGGVRSAAGGLLAHQVTTRFRTGAWSLVRLDQLLAGLGYLPLTWAPAPGETSPDAADAAGQRSAAFEPPAGKFTWNHGYPPELRTFWKVGSADSLVLEGAVMAFENDHGLTMDGVAGPAVWRALFGAEAKGQANKAGYTYARATKYSPETLTIWHNGHIVFHALANTGIPAAPTTSGTAPVYLRYRFQIMRGRNPDGSKYADPVQFVAYFRAGEAVHYFPRASYGFPQSLGCVELPLGDAARAWPFLTYGSLVTVTNP
jgi:peptidoglycan hydrolase-like protein with peptidoglycan-binding domain